MFKSAAMKNILKSASSPRPFSGFARRREFPEKGNSRIEPLNAVYRKGISRRSATETLWPLFRGLKPTATVISSLREEPCRGATM